MSLFNIQISSNLIVWQVGNVYLPGSENLWSEKMAGMNSRLAIVQGGGGEEILKMLIFLERTVLSPGGYLGH